MSTLLLAIGPLLAGVLCVVLNARVIKRIKARGWTEIDSDGHCRVFDGQGNLLAEYDQ